MIHEQKRNYRCLIDIQDMSENLNDEKNKYNSALHNAFRSQKLNDLIRVFEIIRAYILLMQTLLTSMN